MFAILKAVALNYLIQGGQLYWSFPFSKSSVMSNYFTFKTSKAFCFWKRTSYLFLSLLLLKTGWWNLYTFSVVPFCIRIFKKCEILKIEVPFKRWHIKKLFQTFFWLWCHQFACIHCMGLDVLNLSWMYL